MKTLFKKSLNILFILLITLTNSCSNETFDKNISEQSEHDMLFTDENDNNIAKRIPTWPSDEFIVEMDPCVTCDIEVPILYFQLNPCSQTQHVWIDVGDFTCAYKQDEIYIDYSYIDPYTNLTVSNTEDVLQLIDDTLNNPYCGCPAYVGINFQGPSYPISIDFRFRSVRYYGFNPPCYSDSIWYTYTLETCP